MHICAITTNKQQQHDNQTSEHLLGIYASMFRLLSGDSASRVRLLGKFVEKDYEKIQKLIALRRSHASRVTMVDEEIKSERSGLSATEQEDMNGEWLSRRLDAGLFSLQVRGFPSPSSKVPFTNSVKDH